MNCQKISIFGQANKPSAVFNVYFVYVLIKILDIIQIICIHIYLHILKRIFVPHCFLDYLLMNKSSDRSMEV